MPRYCINVKLFLKAERVEDFLKIIADDKKATIETEPTCKQFQVGKSTTEENVYYLHEEYDDKAAFESHTKTAHFASW